MGLNKIVDFSKAKLLKEKGYDEDCKYYYDERGYCTFIKNGLGYYRNEYSRSNSKWKNTLNISAPTISEVVMWIYEKNGIWISVDKQNYKLFKFRISSINLQNNAFCDKAEKSEFNFNSPSLAYTAAIEYILKNYIK